MEFTFGVNSNQSNDGQFNISPTNIGFNTITMNTSNINNNSRKGSGVGKSVGIDLDKIRKSREEQNTQLRKDKRLDTINKHRRRLSEPESDEAGNQVVSSVDQTVLANFKQMLEGDNYDEQLEGATHIRKVLATEKCPPIDLVIRAGVIPRMIQLLDQGRDKPKLQVEIAWSLTNLACGEPEQIGFLASLGVIPAALGIITNDCDEKVRDQLLWTISNLTADRHCRQMLIESGVVNALSSQLGIGANAMPKMPSLSTMHHVACICINLIRNGTPYPTEIRYHIIYIN